MGGTTIGSVGYKSPPLFKSGGYRGYKLQHRGVQILCHFSLTGSGFKGREISKNVYVSYNALFAVLFCNMFIVGSAVQSPISQRL